MVAQAVALRPKNEYNYTAVAALASGDVIQLPNGRAAVYAALNAAVAGQQVRLNDEGVHTLPKTTGVVLLDGGRAYWDWSASAVTFQKVNDRDFYLGTVVGDATSSATSVNVNLNVQQTNVIDIMRDPVLSVPTGTQAVGAFGYPKRLGGAFLMELTATNEAQCIDMLSVDRVAIGAKAILEAIIRVPTNGSGAAVDFNVGLANGTSTTDADAITESAFFHIDGGATDILAESDDGTTEVAATDTTKDITAGSAVANRKELWIDARDKADVRMYIDGVRVLSATTFVLTAASGPLGFLIHLEKTSGTTTGQFVLDLGTIRIMGE